MFGIQLIYKIHFVVSFRCTAKQIQLYIPTSDLGIPTRLKVRGWRKYSYDWKSKEQAPGQHYISDKKGNINSEEFSSFSSLENNEKTTHE